MKLIYKKIFFILFSGMFVACSHSPEKYVHWVQNPENGLKKQVAYQNFVIDIQHKPTDYMLITNSGADKSDKSALDSMQYYNLSMRVPKEFCQQMENNQELRDYLSYRFQEDIYIQQGNDSLPCVLFHYERTLAMKCVASYVLGFENPNQNVNQERFLILKSAFFSEPIRITFSNLETPEVVLP
jgi:hypothetical protein